MSLYLALHSIKVGRPYCITARPGRWLFYLLLFYISYTARASPEYFPSWGGELRHLTLVGTTSSLTQEYLQCQQPTVMGGCLSRAIFGGEIITVIDNRSAAAPRRRGEAPPRFSAGDLPNHERPRGDAGTGGRATHGAISSLAPFGAPPRFARGRQLPTPPAAAFGGQRGFGGRGHEGMEGRRGPDGRRLPIPPAAAFARMETRGLTWKGGARWQREAHGGGPQGPGNGEGGVPASGTGGGHYPGGHNGGDHHGGGHRRGHASRTARSSRASGNRDPYASHGY